MFTGLIEALGTVRSISRHGKGAQLEVAAPFADEVKRGDSIAVNGACLTAIELGGGRFTADVSNETLERTTLGALKSGDPVNLERALAVGQRLGGHYVLGHVDAVGRVASVTDLGEARRVDIEFPAGLAPLLVEKGSIGIDGISLTVNEVGERSFWVAIIPETWAKTVIGRRPPGSPVNLEGDILGKYVLRALATRGAAGLGKGGITEALLAENGYL